MQVQAIHHVAIATRDLQRSLAFYRGVLGLTPAPRPNFPVDGAWLDMGSTQVHLVVHPEATFRTNSDIDSNDCHFALRVESFDAALDHLIQHGYAEDAPEESGRRLLVRRHGPAGFPQVYLLDPDGHVWRSTPAADQSPGTPVSAQPAEVLIGPEPDVPSMKVI